MKTPISKSRIYSSFLLLSVLFAMGCGFSRNVASPMNGNWVATLSAPGTSNAFQNKATFGMSGLYESATGEALFGGFPCVAPNAPVAVAGTQDLFTLDTTWTAPLGQDSILTVNGQQTENLSAIEGTFSLTGTHCGGLTSGNFSATNYSPLTGNYLGSIVATQGNSISILASLQQTDLVDQTGKYPISGSVDVTPDQCVNNPTLVNSYVTGDTFSISYVSADQSQLNITGTFSPDAKTMNLQKAVISGGPCDGFQGAGTLTKN